MSKKPTSVYDDTPSKKEVGLIVSMLKGMFQFPANTKYRFESIDGTSFLVVYNEDGPLAHVTVENLISVCGPTTLFRDGRWR